MRLTIFGRTRRRVVGYTPSPFIDPIASNFGSNEETVYVLGNGGLLYRIASDTANYTLTAAQTYQMPNTPVTGDTMLYDAAPIILGGQFAIAALDHDSTDPANDVSHIYKVNTNASSYSTSSGSSATISSAYEIGTIAHNSIIVDCDSNLVPKYAFVPAGLGLAMVNLVNTGNRFKISNDLVVNSNSPTSGNISGVDPSLYNDGVVHVNNRVTIDSYDHAAYVANCNAVWKLSYNSSTYDSTVEATNYNSALANWTQRSASFGNTSRTTFALSYHGENTDVVDPTDSIYITNNTGIYYDGDLYMIDNNASPGYSTGCTFNHFTANGGSPTTAPSRITADDYDLTGNASVGDAPYTQLGTNFITANYNTYQFNLGTLNNSNTGCAFWVFDF